MKTAVRRQIYGWEPPKRSSAKSAAGNKGRVTPAQARANALARYSSADSDSGEEGEDEEDSYIESVSDSEEQ